ncbi:helix-turn-helix domain-containing protein [Paracoccus sanguinis]|uniref:4-hydroxy-3-methylbut-2-en-1-yl diphosphate synthase n=1 Tax=Paracoccus sanguinis TaxID=1545044 RepID=A0A099G9F7_9RHOB|nr:helix-turn-helix domain-containing protein [Paracoccus sanguinis]KGJ13001.1 4-hydroxy-3-methylbut-2-en-1-yl diphosphate synthase [Paracoccus sanguinis]KGJ19460.1 4-hydroxy-3-methylbut-2-en-1-yl diphosphate synthase [Paracoccus sanguinis]
MIGMRAPATADDSSLGQGTPANAPAFDDFEMRLGDIMRGERATMGKSLLDVQRELRIRASYVAAVENCDVSAFDAPSFVSGYVRSYARYLGMDPDWVFQRFCQESGFQPVHGMAPAAAGPKPTRRPADPAEALANPKALFIPQKESFWSSVEPRAIGSVLVMAGLALGLGYGGWAVLQEVQKVNLTPSDQSPAVIATLDPVQDTAAAEPVDMAAADLPQPEALDRVYRPQALDVPELTPRDTPIAAIDPGLQAAETPQVREAAADPAIAAPSAAPLPGMAGVQTAMAGPQPEGAPVQPVRTLAPDAPQVEIMAARPAWVRVSAADGTVILEKTMDAGERFALPSTEQPPVLRTGNSGAVYFAVNGQTYGPAAPGPQVVKNVELSPAALTQKYALADPAADPELASMVAMATVSQAGQATGAPVE